MEVQIVETSIVEAIDLLQLLPEFQDMRDNPYYQERIENSKSLTLLATIDSKPIACKVGYDKFKDGSFYSWLGGVLPKYRRLGIAKALADKQEDWAKSEGFKSIKFKTLNRHKGMLIFAIKNGFKIYSTKSKDEFDNYRIEMIKDLL
ncbi:GNAT family N-acetyltransferase [Roseivirga sp. E12]|uniref:GNAT family N-acetyltransferase n=1 Tax=Roseivirga sp. E12 TaxID=2819237 RepID=UPI001ABBEA3D|nr:GNAT family N-acetyltransferase [Roseivirga sp. E12]MBO3700437.1 GNAT family N-acetyltransferase [Roseivirga sp. E12]